MNEMEGEEWKTDYVPATATANHFYIWCGCMESEREREPNNEILEFI